MSNQVDYEQKYYDAIDVITRIAREKSAIERRHKKLVKVALAFLRRMDMPHGNILGYEDANGRSLDPLVRQLAALVNYSLVEQNAPVPTSWAGTTPDA